MVDLGRIPGALVIPAGIEVNLLWTCANGKTARNTLGGSVASGFSATAVIAEAVRAAIVASGAWTAWAARLHSTVSFAGVELRDLRSANLPLVQSTGAAAPGTGAGLALPSQDALVVTLRTALAGRANRGRVYLVGFDSGTLVAATGSASAGTLTDATSFITEVQTALGASGITLAIKHPARAAYTGKRGAAIPARSAGMVPVTEIVCRDAIFDSQRRRNQV